jgi:hypothetical protein
LLVTFLPLGLTVAAAPATISPKPWPTTSRTCGATP